MKVRFTNAFEKDVSKIQDRKIAVAIISVVEDLKKSKSLAEVTDVKKMHGASNAFRIKVKDFRIGCYLEKDTVLLSRVLNRKDIYKYFP